MLVVLTAVDPVKDETIAAAGAGARGSYETIDTG